MSLIVRKTPLISFHLQTTKPFHSKEAAQKFFELILSYGAHYRPYKYGNFEPIKNIFDEKNLQNAVLAWFEGKDIPQETLESDYCTAQLLMKGRSPSKINYYVGWQNWANSVLFNYISVNISRDLLKKSEKEMTRYINFCNDLVCLFSPVHAEIYDYISAIPCYHTKNAFIPDDLSVRCPALKWRTYFGTPYINLFGRDTILNAPCWRAEEVGNTIAVQLTETVFENVPHELRQKVVDYFEESVSPDIRIEQGKGFIFRPFDASESYAKSKKLVPEFPIQEFFGKNIDDKKAAEAALSRPL